jgi:hypothetical protein
MPSRRQADQRLIAGPRSWYESEVTDPRLRRRLLIGPFSTLEDAGMMLLIWGGCAASVAAFFWLSRWLGAPDWFIGLGTGAIAGVAVVLLIQLKVARYRALKDAHESDRYVP